LPSSKSLSSGYVELRLLAANPSPKTKTAKTPAPHGRPTEPTMKSCTLMIGMPRRSSDKERACEVEYADSISGGDPKGRGDYCGAHED